MSITLIEAAQEAVRLRAQQKEIDARLRELALIINSEQVRWSDNGVRYNVNTKTRVTLSIDEEKMRLVDPVIYERCAIKKVSEAVLRKLIDGREAPRWELYASKSASTPYISVTTKEDREEETNE